MSTSRRKPYETEEPVTAEELLEATPFDGDLDAELAPRPEGRRMSTATLALGAGLLLVVGMLAGIQAHKSWGASANTQLVAGGGGQRGGGAGAPGGAGAGYPGMRQGQGQGAGQGQASGNPASGNVTIGTVKLVDGSKIYVETTSGVITVKTSGDTKVQVSKDGKVKDLKPGSSVVVQGERGTDGSVSATSVNQGGAIGGVGNRSGG
ncbi:MAG: hypothetical protein JWQ95_5401 [Sphaerisporangium sp.]|nr:hypothetical protein [Sphaerisporangium sp.]